MWHGPLNTEHALHRCVRTPTCAPCCVQLNVVFASKMGWIIMEIQIARKKMYVQRRDMGGHGEVCARGPRSPQNMYLFAHLRTIDRHQRA